MSGGKGEGDGGLEIGTKGVKVPVRSLAQLFFPGRVARSEAIIGLTCVFRGNVIADFAAT